MNASVSTIAPEMGRLVQRYYEYEIQCWVIKVVIEGMEMMKQSIESLQEMGIWNKVSAAL